MKAFYIYPEDIGASDQWSSEWVKFITKLGWNESGTPWGCVLIANIETNQ